jgi:putative transposase
MAHMRRCFEKGHAYFVTSVTNEREPIFISEKMCEILLVTIEYFKLLLDYKIYAYCIMPDHLHLIIQPVGKYNLSYIMQMIKGSFSRKINKIGDKNGKIWQKRFYDEGIRNESMLMQKIEYVHNNPLRKNLVNSPEEYSYSSYHCYFGNNKNVLEVDQLNY